jgi:hypothetical protein
MLVGNVVTSGHQARTMSLSSSLEAQKKKIKKTIKLRIKGIEWARKEWNL